MSSFTSRKAAAGFASGFLSVAALIFVLAALMIGLGPTRTSGFNQVRADMIGAAR